MSTYLLSKITVNEQRTNIIIHGFGTIVSLIALIFLVYFNIGKNSNLHVISNAIFVSSLFIMFLSSTLYHNYTNSYIRTILKAIDNASVFILIAAAYTPFLLVNIQGHGAWCVLGLIWVFAVTGSLIKMFRIGSLNKISVIAYISLGWICIILFHKILSTVPPTNFSLLILGSVLYTIGIYFYCWKTLKYSHAIWHSLVLSGSISHYFAVILT